MYREWIHLFLALSYGVTVHLVALWLQAGQRHTDSWFLIISPQGPVSDQVKAGNGAYFITLCFLQKAMLYSRK